MTNKKKVCFTEGTIRVRFTITELWGGRDTHTERQPRKTENGRLQAFKHSGPVALQIKMVSELQCYYFFGAERNFRSHHTGNYTWWARLPYWFPLWTRQQTVSISTRLHLSLHWTCPHSSFLLAPFLLTWEGLKHCLKAALRIGRDI